MRMVGVKVMSGRKGYLERRLMAVEGHLERAYHRWIERRGAGITRNNKHIIEKNMYIKHTYEKSCVEKSHRFKLVDNNNYFFYYK